jgi:flavodoxin
MSSAPRALVVYESMFGNTEKVAGAVAHGLQLEGVDTGLVEARSAPASLPEELDLLVVGGPTHAFTMSRSSTRADAVRQGAPAERADVGIREWLASVRLEGDRHPLVAAFDTRVTKVRWLPQAAGASASRLARRRGLVPLARPIGFLVDDVRGPLVDSELEHAAKWGRHLGAVLMDRAAPEVSTTGRG